MSSEDGPNPSLREGYFSRWLVYRARSWRIEALSFCFGILTSIESILVIRARVVCDLDAGTSLVGILEQVDVRTLVESMVGWLLRRKSVEVMNIAEASVAIVRKKPSHVLP